MKNTLTSFLILSVAFIGLPLSGLAEAPVDAFADSVYSPGIGVLSSQNVIGAPDDIFASFVQKDATAVFDMGEGEEGTDDLILYYELLDLGAAAFIEFLNEDLEKLATPGIVFDHTVNTVTVTYDEALPYRYVRILSTQAKTWKLDTIQAVDFLGQEPEVPEVVVEEEVIEPEEEIFAEPTLDANGLTQGTLIKLPNDDNPDTSVDSAIYIIDADAKRHAFPNEQIFFSWFDSFDGVQEVSQEVLSSYSLGKNVTLRAGTKLMKLVTVPTVYAVELGGILRALASETVAQDLYGEDWADRVIDMPDVFFSNYTIGDPIDTSVHPSGTLALSHNGMEYYIRNGVRYSLSNAIWSRMNFQSIFYVDLSVEQYNDYVDGGALEDDVTIRWPY